MTVSTVVAFVSAMASPTGQLDILMLDFVPLKKKLKDLKAQAAKEASVEVDVKPDCVVTEKAPTTTEAVQSEATTNAEQRERI